jgi:hypothetical protein
VCDDEQVLVCETVSQSTRSTRVGDESAWWYPGWVGLKVERDGQTTLCASNNTLSATAVQPPSYSHSVAAWQVVRGHTSSGIMPEWSEQFERHMRRIVLY